MYSEIYTIENILWTDIPGLEYKDSHGKPVRVSGSVAKIVLAAIADSINWSMSTSFDTLAIKTCLEKRSVCRAVRALITAGYIKSVSVSSYGTNDYILDTNKINGRPQKTIGPGRPKGNNPKSRRGGGTGLWGKYGKELSEKYGKRCYYCGIELQDYGTSNFCALATVDHVIPKSKGGKNSIDNYVPCCLSCNARKKDKIL